VSSHEFVEPGRLLDVSSEPVYAAPTASRDTASARQFVGIRFTCCDVYTRVYIDDGRDSYLARCPRCMRGMRLVIDPLGSTARFFEAS
jgi:hypothetical protein